MSPFRRSEVSAFDFVVDSNKLGVFFSPIEIINRDILFDIGGGDIDSFIANPDDQYKPEYSQLKDLREYFSKDIMEHLIIVCLSEQYQGLINLYLDKLKRCYQQEQKVQLDFT